MSSQKLLKTLHIVLNVTNKEAALSGMESRSRSIHIMTCWIKLTSTSEEFLKLEQFYKLISIRKHSVFLEFSLSAVNDQINSINTSN